MNEAILKKTRLWTLVAAAGVCMITGFAFSIRFAAGVMLTALWAVAGFWALERLLKATIVAPGRKRNGRSVVGWAAVKLAVYALAIWALFDSPFPAMSHLIGFSLLLIALVAAGITALPQATKQPAGRGDNG